MMRRRRLFDRTLRLIGRQMRMWAPLFQCHISLMFVRALVCIRDPFLMAALSMFGLPYAVPSYRSSSPSGDDEKTE